MIEQVPKTFETLNSAIEYYLTQCPTRQKSQTIEPVGGCKPSYSDFDRNHPSFVWARLSLGFVKVYQELQVIEQMAFKFWLKMYRPDQGIEDIAKYHGVDKTALFNAKKYVKEALEDSLIDSDLMPMPDNWNRASRWEPEVYRKH